MNTSGLPHKRGKKSIFDRLPSEQREALIDWLVLENVSYDVAQQRLKERFGVTASIGSICGFWQRFCAPRLQQKKAQAAGQPVATFSVGERHFDIFLRPNNS